MTSVVWYSGICVVAASLIACNDRNALERQARAATSQRLIGTWDARFQLDQPLVAERRTGSRVRHVTGQLAFLANRWVSRTYPAIGSPSDYGTFDVDFTPFGFDPRSNNETPTAVAGWLGNDSLEVMLGDPAGDITVRMGGHVADDSISGDWTVMIARTGGGGGRFVMVRHQ